MKSGYIIYILPIKNPGEVGAYGLATLYLFTTDSSGIEAAGTQGKHRQIIEMGKITGIVFTKEIGP